MQTLDQQRARAAWEATEAATVNEKYVSLCSGAPVLILTNSLGPALAFLLSKASEGSHHLRLADALAAWVLRREPGEDKSGRDLMRAITLADIPTYRRYTTDALAYLNWLKRFAVAADKADGEDAAEEVPDSPAEAAPSSPPA